MMKAQKCARLLSHEDDCYAAMKKAVLLYPICAQQHLSKPTGKRPWLGQAACVAELGATEEETRIAWNFYMSVEERERANAMADKVVAEWEAGNA